MKIMLSLLLVALSFLNAQKILVINSNSQIDRYHQVEDAFKTSFTQPATYVDISQMDEKEIRNYLYDFYPDIVYTIGTKAYQYAYKYIPEKKIFFSSIVNYERLSSTKRYFGVSNELHSGMQLTLIKSFFPTIKDLTVIYSDYTQDILEHYNEEAKVLGITLTTQKISSPEMIDKAKLAQSDGLLLIADPILIKDEAKVKEIFKYMKQKRKPIFAYHELFIAHGATLVISIDANTIGRQIASMIHSFSSDNAFTPIQVPVGTTVIFNQRVANQLSRAYVPAALGVATKVVK
ncbi:MAG: ABC transporter substrate binding protein [Campylobacterota bacterium]|nr:ABC transporter substrate binding protein [Campylobacterota bacterium]